MDKELVFKFKELPNDMICDKNDVIILDFENKTVSYDEINEYFLPFLKNNFYNCFILRNSDDETLTSLKHFRNRLVIIKMGEHCCRNCIHLDPQTYDDGYYDWDENYHSYIKCSNCKFSDDTMDVDIINKCEYYESKYDKKIMI